MSHVAYASFFGSLIYAMVYIRLDISHIVGILRRCMLTSRKEHWTTIKRVFWYLCGTLDYAIYYQGKPRQDREVNVHGFVNS